MVEYECRLKQKWELSLSISGLVSQWLPLHHWFPSLEMGCLEYKQISPISANMWVSNQSSLDDFILLGFSDRSWLETPLFVILSLVAYICLFLDVYSILVFAWIPSWTVPYAFSSLIYPFWISALLPSTLQMLVNLWGPEKTINYGGCVAQLYISLWPWVLYGMHTSSHHGFLTWIMPYAWNHWHQSS